MGSTMKPCHIAALASCYLLVLSGCASQTTQSTSVAASQKMECVCGTAVGMENGKIIEPGCECAPVNNSDSRFAN